MNGKQIYIRSVDYERLKAYADANRRTLCEQVSVVLDVFEKEVAYIRHERKTKARKR